MRILLLNYEYPPIGGGASTATQNLLKQLSAKEGIEIDLVTSSAGESRQEQFASNIRIFFLNIVKKGDLHKQSHKDLLVYSWLAYRTAKKLAKQKKYDLVHAFFGIPCGFVAMKMGLPYVVSLRGSDVPFYSEKYKLLDKLFFQRLSRKIWKKAKAVVANSEGLKKLAHETSPEREISVIPNGVDTELFKPADEGPDEFVVISTSRFEKRKGLEFLVRGFAQFRKKSHSGKLVMVGDGDQQEFLKDLTKRLGIDGDVRFVGSVPREKMPQIYQLADVFVLPSLNEGMSNSLLEAMSSGLAVVATDTGGTKELVDESSGIIVGKKNPDQIANALLKLASNKEILDNMKASSRQKAEGMSWNIMAEGYIKIYEQSFNVENNQR